MRRKLTHPYQFISLFVIILHSFLFVILFTVKRMTKKVLYGAIYVKDSYLLIYLHIAPGNFSLLAQRKVAEKESALVRALLRDFYFKKIVFYL